MEAARGDKRAACHSDRVDADARRRASSSDELDPVTLEPIRATARLEGRSAPGIRRAGVSSRRRFGPRKRRRPRTMGSGASGPGAAPPGNDPDLLRQRHPGRGLETRRAQLRHTCVCVFENPHRLDDRKRIRTGLAGDSPHLNQRSEPGEKAAHFFVAVCNGLLYPLPKYWEKRI